MDAQESTRLRKEYAELFDEQLIELALQDEGDFAEGAYDLIMAEVRNRNIEEKVKAMRSIDGKKTGQDELCNTDTNEGLDNANISDQLVPIIIILREDDLAYIASVLDNARITYCSEPLHLKGKEYPRLIMVPQEKVDQIIGLFSSIIPSASILLWR